jgi:hypothetical protein
MMRLRELISGLRKSGDQGRVGLLTGAKPRAETLRPEVYIVAEESAISLSHGWTRSAR